MKKRLSALVLGCLVCLVCAPAWGGASGNLNPDQAYNILKQRQGVYLLDVRTFGEYQQARLDGAHLIPIDQLTGRLAEVPRDRPVLVYCAVGSRSAQVANYLTRQGFAEVYNLSGGIYAWANRNYPILQGLP